MRGFLKSREGVFLLAANTTTIGREGCDLVLQGAGGDCLQATIEYIEEDASFMLQDVNSIHGIYVNDCCIKKTAVKLEPNDIICFGYNGIPYEFVTELNRSGSSSSAHCAHKNFTGRISYESGLAQLISSFPQSSRPTSSVLCKQNVEKTKSDSEEITDGAGWISGPRKRIADRVDPCSEPPTDNNLTVADMQHQLHCLQLEVNRLLIFEAECMRKDDTIEQLREEITNLQNFVRLVEVDRCPVCQRESLSGNSRLLQLEPESAQVDAELASRLQQLSTPSTGVNAAVTGNIDASGLLHTVDAPTGQINDVNTIESSVSTAKSSKVSVGELNAELTKTRDACNLSVSLACQMQRDMANKDDTISRMATEIESLKEKLLERDIQISVLEESLQRFDEGKLVEDAGIQARDREIALLRHKLKTADAVKHDKSSQLVVLTEELTKCKVALETEKHAEKKLKAEVESLKVKNQDLERTERVARIDVEQLSKRFEKLRSRAVQTAFAGGSSKIPDKLISDDELLTLLKKCADERSEAHKKPPAAQEPKKK
jgi:hypothetical protein